MAALPTLSPTGQDIAGGWTDEAGGTTNLHLLIDEAVGSPGTDYIRGALNGGTSEGRFDITNMPADFDTLLTLTISCRHSRGSVEAGSASGDDTGVLRVIIRDASDVALSDAVTIYNAGGGGYLARTETGVSITGLVDTSNQTRWDGAKVCISTTWGKVKGNDNHYTWVDAVSLGGTYTPAAAATYDETGRATTITSTVTVTDVLTAPTLTQSAFRFRTGDTVALNAATGWEDAINTNVTLGTETEFRLRTQITGAGSAGAKTYELWYSKNGGAYAIVPNNTVPWDENGGAGNQWEIQLVNSNQFADGDATTELLAGSGTFVAGEGVEVEPTASITLTDTQDTEIEWCLLPRKLSNNGHLADADYFEFRVYESDGTPLDTYTYSPRVTINNGTKRPGTVGGAFGEMQGVTLHEDKSGNLYLMQEYTDATLGTQTRENSMVMMKSTDGGTSWSAMDTSGEPTPTTYYDIEAVDSVYVAADDTIYIASQGYSSDSVWYVEYYAADHATLADTWGTPEVVDTTTQNIAPAQSVSIVRRSDDTTVVFYADGDATDDFPQFKVRSAGGTWDTTPTQLDYTATDDYFGAVAVLDSNDDTHIFYTQHPGGASDGVLWHKKLTSADSLGSRTQVNDGTTVMAGNLAAHRIHGPPVIYFPGGVETVAVGYNDESRWPFYNESPVSSIAFSNDEAINTTRKTWSGGGGSNQLQAQLIPNGDEMIWMYTYSSTGTEIYTITRNAAGTWANDTQQLQSTARIEGTNYIWGDQGQLIADGTKLGIMWWDHPLEGATGGTIFDSLSVTIMELRLATTIASTVTVTDTLGGGTTYDETLRATTITSTITSTDVLGFYETGLATTIASTIASTDVLSAVELLATTITSTIASTDLLSFYDLLMPTTITSTIASTDVLSAVELLATTVASTITSTDVQNYVDLLATTINSTIVLTDLYFDVEQFATTITSTVASTDVLSAVELLATTITSTIASTDVISYKELLLATTIASTITSTDVLSAVDLLATTITSTITLTDVQDYVDLLATTITSTITSIDTYTPVGGYDETLRATVITSTITSTDTFTMYELLNATTINSTVNGIDVQSFVDLLATTVASTVTVLDALNASELLLATTITSTDTVADAQGYAQIAEVTISSTITSTDVQSFIDLLQTSIISTISLSDVQTYTAEQFDIVIASIINLYDTYYPIGYTPPARGKHFNRFARTTSTGVRTDGRFVRS